MTMPQGGDFSSFVIDMIKNNITIKQLNLKYTAIDIRDKHGKNILYYAIKAKNNANVEILIENNIPLIVALEKHALFLAIECNNFWCVKYLIENKKIEVNLKDSNGKTPIIYAIFYNRLKIIKYLLKQGANIFQADIYTSIPIDFAMRTDIDEIQNVLKKHIKNEMLKKDIIF